MVEWYNLAESERVNQIYSKFSIKKFWDWWADGKDRVMEIRFRGEYSIVKEVSETFYLPRGKPGVYVDSADKLKKVIGFAREKTPVWFGVNPRKKNYNDWGNLSYGGLDANVAEIAYVFFDIDRIEKDGEAQPYELKNAQRLVDLILEQFGKHGWDQSYCVICSGNGVQILLKLDVPIRLPKLTYNSETKRYEHNPEFDKIKNIIKEGVGKEAISFASRFEKDLNVTIDAVALNIGRVAALPVTKNFKYGGFTWRGILDMKDGVNKGLSDYILSRKSDIKEYKSKKVFKVQPKEYFEYDFEPFTEENLFTHKYVDTGRNLDWMKLHDVNNKYWYAFKLFLCYFGLIDKETLTYKTPQIKEDVENIHKEFVALSGGRSLPMNFVPSMFEYNFAKILEIGNGTFYVNYLPLEWPMLVDYKWKIPEVYKIIIPKPEDVKYVRNPIYCGAKFNYVDIMETVDKIDKIILGYRDRAEWKDLRQADLEFQRQMLIKDVVKGFAKGFIDRHGEDAYMYFYNNKYLEKRFNYRITALKRRE